MSLGMSWRVLKTWAEYQADKKRRILERAKEVGWQPKHPISFYKYTCYACQERFEGQPAWVWESDSGYSTWYLCHTCGVEAKVYW